MIAGKGVRVGEVRLYFLPYRLETPLKFGRETTGRCECVRVWVGVTKRGGAGASGWGEVPIGAAWAWPSLLALESRTEAMRAFCQELAAAWLGFGAWGAALELGWRFLCEVLPSVWTAHNAERRSRGEEDLPWLAALLCAAPFDIALHDAYGRASGAPSFETLNADYLERDLAWFYWEGSSSPFSGLYPQSFLARPPFRSLPVWHLVGAADRLETGSPAGPSGLPGDLVSWIRRDGLQLLKVKLLGRDLDADYDRLVAVGRIAQAEGIEGIGIDFNGTVEDQLWMRELLDRLGAEEAGTASLLRYVEQPFSPDLRGRGLHLGELGSRILMVLDEAATDYSCVDLGLSLGWGGIALKTCKTLTGAILSLCRARAAGMEVLVQDLTNPMLALIPHALLAANAGSMSGLEANAAQFCPSASAPEAELHPGLYRRSSGRISLESLTGAGLCYAGAEEARSLPEPAWAGGVL